MPTVIMIAGVVVRCLVGVAAAAGALALVLRDKRAWQTRLFSLRGAGALFILTGGCILAAGGGHALLHDLNERGQRTVAETKSDLQEPFDEFSIIVRGPNPFRDPSVGSFLRFHVSTEGGPGFVSQIPRSVMRPVAASTADRAEYRVAWQSVIENAEGDEGTMLAAQLRRLVEWGRVERVQLEIITTAASTPVLPVWLEIVRKGSCDLSVFRGTQAAATPVREADTWVSAYRDKFSPAERLSVWMSDAMPTENKAGLRAATPLMVALLLLAAGAGLRLAGHGTRGEAIRGKLAGTWESVNRQTLGPDRGTSQARLLAQPWFWLALQTVLLFAYYSHFQMAPEGHAEGQRACHAYGDGYLKNSLASEISWDSFVASLTSGRTFGLPLLLKCVRTFSPSFAAWPLWQLSLRVLAVFVFALGLRSIGVAGLLTTALASTLFYSDMNFWERGEYEFIGPNCPAESFAILTLGMLFLVIGNPHRSLSWCGLALSLFFTYQTHPSYLFLIALVPFLGLVLLGLVSTRVDWIQLRRRVTIGLLAVSLVPFLAWCTLRLALVGHFGLVSFGGYAAISIPGLWLSNDLVPALPADLRPLARAVLHDRAQLKGWQMPRNSKGGFHLELDQISDVDIFKAITWPSIDIYTEDAMSLYGRGEDETFNGQDWVTVNRKLTEMAVALIKAKPFYFVDWLLTAFRVSVYTGLVTQLLKYLVKLLILMVGIWHVCYVVQRLRLGSEMEANPGKSGSYRLELNIMLLIGVSFAIARVFQVVLVAPPIGRHMSSAGVFLPTIAVISLFALGRQIRALLFARTAKAAP